MQISPDCVLIGSKHPLYRNCLRFICFESHPYGRGWTTSSLRRPCLVPGRLRITEGATSRREPSLLYIHTNLVLRGLAFAYSPRETLDELHRLARWVPPAETINLCICLSSPSPQNSSSPYFQRLERCFTPYWNSERSNSLRLRNAAIANELDTPRPTATYPIVV